jgi:DNA topoisomerase-3
MPHAKFSKTSSINEIFANFTFWSTPGQGEVICPKCKTAHIRFYPKVAKCADPNCGLIVFRSISEKELSDKQILELLTKGKTAVINGFKSKAGKIFPAALKFDENYRLAFDFVEKKRNFKKKS